MMLGGLARAHIQEPWDAFDADERRACSDSAAPPSVLRSGMPHTIVAVDQRTRQQGMLIEAYPEPLPQPEMREALDGLERRLFHERIRVGVLATPADLLVVRDLGVDRTFKSDDYQVRSLPSAKLLEHAGLGEPRHGDAFIQQLRRWLDAVATSWISYLWPEALGVIIPHVLGHLVNVDLEEYDDLLGAGDAA
jgi:hypothetical protein